MDVRIQIFAIAASGLCCWSILELVRRRRLLERYALLWLFSAIVLLILAVWRGLLEDIARFIGVAYPPNALFFIAFGFVLVLLLHFSTRRVAAEPIRARCWLSAWRCSRSASAARSFNGRKTSLTPASASSASEDRG